MKRLHLPIVLASLLAFAALAIIVAAFLPYGMFKGLADSLTSDRDFTSLRQANAVVFRLLLVTAGIVLLALAALIVSGRIGGFKTFMASLGRDGRDFGRALKPARADGGFLAALALIFVVATIFRLAHIQDPMTHDESYTYMAYSSTSLFNIITNYELPNNHVLNSLLIFVSTHLLGMQPWAVRLPALLAGLLLIPACYALGKAIYDPYTGLASALLLAVLPGAIVFSTTGRGYSLTALFTLLALWLANYLRGNRNLLAWSLLVLCCALGFYSVPVMLFPFGIVFGWLFFENLVTEPGPYASRTNFLKYWLVAGFATAGLVLLLYTPIFIYTGAGKVFANQFVTPEPWRGYLASIPRQAASVWGEWTDGLPPILGILLLAGFVLSMVFHRRLARQRFPLQAATFLWLGALLLIQRPQGVTKIWAFLQAPFMIWAAAGTVGLLRDIRPKFTRRISIAAILIALGLAAALAVGVSSLPTLPSRWADKGATEKTVLALKDRLGPQDLVLVDPAYAPAVWYYSRLHGIPAGHFDPRLPFGQLFVIGARHGDRTLESIIQEGCSRSCPINLDAAKLIFNYQQLDTYELPHR